MGRSEFCKGSGVCPAVPSSFLLLDVVLQPPHQLTRDSGLAGWVGRATPRPRNSPASSPSVHTATLGGAIFVPSLLFIVPKPCAVGERHGVCFMIASFPPITFRLKTGFALILDPRPGSLGGVPPGVRGGGTEIPGRDPDFAAKLSADVLPFGSPGTFPGYKLAAPNLLPWRASPTPARCRRARSQTCEMLRSRRRTDG